MITQFERSKLEFEKLFSHQMSDSEMRDFLISMRLDEHTSVDAIAAAATVMREYSISLPYDKSLQPKLIDIVGTGGDKIGSFNISSTTSLLASAAGLYVAKHGNRSITSKSGSADLFEVLNVRLDLSVESSAKLLEECGFTFMFAQNHHPAMKFIMPIRKSIDEKTIFNVLGPLTNPAKAEKFLLGVFDKSFVPKIAQALELMKIKSALVVSSREKMDEISISDITYASKVIDSKATGMFEINPADYNLKMPDLSAIAGGDAKENAQILHNIFTNRATDAQRDIVLINAAHAFVVDGIARDVQDGLEIARETINSGKAVEKLKQIQKVSAQL